MALVAPALRWPRPASPLERGEVIAVLASRLKWDVRKRRNLANLVCVKASGESGQTCHDLESGEFKAKREAMMLAATRRHRWANRAKPANRGEDWRIERSSPGESVHVVADEFATSAVGGATCLGSPQTVWPPLIVERSGDSRGPVRRTSRRGEHVTKITILHCHRKRVW